MSKEQNPPKVFISYSHDSHDHLNRVLALADRLRAEGIDCNLDQYEPAPYEGWPRWMENQFRQADFILIVCTETYCRRFEGREEQGKGLGAKWEGAIITAELYRDETINKRFIPIAFSAEDVAQVPNRLRDYTRYIVIDDGDYDLLYRHLTNQPRVVKPPLGLLRSLGPVNRLRSLPSEERQQEFAPIVKAPAPKPHGKPTSLPAIAESSETSSNSFTDSLDGVKLEMIYISGGEFLMGAPNGVGGSDERPQHRVEISPFHIGRFQITQGQWQMIMKTNPSIFAGDDLPVERISWEMAVEFCRKLSGQTGKNYRLPTEAEWEYACRAGSTGQYCFGDDQILLDQYAWYDKNSNEKTHPVGQKKPNAWGLHDMHGNVWEWCQDWRDRKYYSKSPIKNPSGPSQSVDGNRVVRGGEYSLVSAACTSFIRDGYFANYGNATLGFRVVCGASTP